MQLATRDSKHCCGAPQRASRIQLNSLTVWRLIHTSGDCITAQPCTRPYQRVCERWRERVHQASSHAEFDCLRPPNTSRLEAKILWTETQDWFPTEPSLSNIRILQLNSGKAYSRQWDVSSNCWRSERLPLKCWALS